jgi:hypothetical protein
VGKIPRQTGASFVRVRTLFRYLTGDRQAILELAADRHALWIGLLFVLSAGFAREYDGQDLLREPWYLLVPVGASLAASFLLFLFAFGSLFLRREGRPPFLAAYRSFLTLFWMTAPLAWLYAVPYERFLSPGDATSANLWTLALVAAWRVALMVRVVSVLTGRGVAPSLFLVMAFGDAVALSAVFLMPKPIVSIMGGVRLTDSERAVFGATMLVTVLGTLSAPLWGIGGLIAFFSGKPSWQLSPAGPEPAGPVPADRGGLALAVASLAIWLPILPWTQAEQRLRSQVELDMKHGRIAEGLDVLSAHAASDFPPQWDPPPRIGYGETAPDILDVMEVIASGDYAPWVRACYLDKFRRYLGDDFTFRYEPKSGAELAQLVRVLQRLPEGPAIASEQLLGLEIQLSHESLSEEDRENITAIVELAKKSDVRPDR